MQKKILAASVLAFLILTFAVSCKKSPTHATNGNVPHALSDSFYVRALLDTTWIYASDDYKDECQANGVVCSSFLLFTPNSNLVASQFNLSDSAHPNPQDTTILSWVGKTFVTKSDTSSHHALTFSFSYPDTLGKVMSTDYIVNNTGAQLTVTSVVYDGLSTHTFDSITPYKMYKLQGTLTCKLTHFGDSVVHKITQGVYSINVMEAAP